MRTLVRIGDQPRPSAVTQLGLTTDLDKRGQRSQTGKRLALVLGDAEQHSAVGGVIFRVVRRENQFFNRKIGWRVATFFPGLWNAIAPALFQKRQVGIRAAEQQYLVLERIATGQHRQILLHNGVSQ